MAMECAESGFLWREVAELERELKLTSEERRSKYSKIARHFEIVGNNAEMADVIFVLWNPNTEVWNISVRSSRRLFLSCVSSTLSRKLYFHKFSAFVDAFICGGCPDLTNCSFKRSIGELD